MPLVGSHQQGAFSTPQNGQPTDASVVLANDNANRTTTNAHDADATIHVQSSVLASRPAAGTAQRVWITTDGLRFYLDSGSVWNELDYLSKTAGGTVAGAVTLSASLTAAGASFSGAVTAAGVTADAAAHGANVTLRNSGTRYAVITDGTAALGDGTSNLVLFADSGNGITFVPNATSASRMILAPSGALTVADRLTISAGGLTVSSGTTAVQALTATTGAFSSSVTSASVALSGATPYIVGGSVSTRFLSNDGLNTNVSITDVGAVTIRAGLGVSAGGVTISAGGLAVTGGITGTLSTAAQPNITSVGVLASPHMTSPTVDSGGLTVTAGGLTVTGNSVVTGTLKASAQGLFGPNSGSGTLGFLAVSSDTVGTASAGAASLPAAPVGFLAWYNGSTVIKIPYYA